MPSATMPTKAKLRVTLNRLRSVAKVSVASDRTMQAISAARKIQNVCWPASQESGPACWRRPIAVFSASPAAASPATGDPPRPRVNINHSLNKSDAPQTPTERPDGHFILLRPPLTRRGALFFIQNINLLRPNQSRCRLII
jgi:hypothetical protein